MAVRFYVAFCAVCSPTLSLMVGQSTTWTKRRAITGRMQMMAVRKMVSHTFGWFREFLAVPEVPEAAVRHHVMKWPVSHVCSKDQASPEKAEKILTDEGEHGGEDEEHAVAVQGECGGKINGHAAPHEEVVHCGPVPGFQDQLENTACYSAAHVDTRTFHDASGGLTCMLTTTSRDVCASKAKD